MALASAFLSEDQFTCSICLEVFNNPVSTPCGHSFCQTCISSYWDGKTGGGGGGAKNYQCPLCKESFRKRPELHINRTLKEITEQFKWMSSVRIPKNEGVGGEVENSNSYSHHQHQTALSPPQKPGKMPENIFAEMMTRFQQLPNPGVSDTAEPDPGDRQPRSSTAINVHPSVKAQNNEHNDLPPPHSSPRRYTVSGPSDISPNLPPCPIHRRGLEFFCRTDNTCICNVCVETAEHRGHNIVPAKREWQIKKSQLGISEVELRDLISEKETKVEEIHNSLREIQAAAESQIDGTVCVFSKLISSAERCQAEVLEVIEINRQAAEHRAQILLKELNDEIAELKKRRTALNQLAVSEDYISFLKMFPTLSTTPQTKDWSSVTLVSELTSGAILRNISQMMEHLQEEMGKIPEICQRSSVDQSVPRPNPKIKTVQEYAANITLDPNTAHPRLLISADGKQVQCGERHRQVLDSPERFDRVVCVLSHQGFSSGRHYWEVEVGSKTDWDLGVASWSVNRKGKITVSPANGYWFLSLRDQTDYAFRTEPSTSLTVHFRPLRVGIFLDYDKGLISFYNVNARVLIYTYRDTFSDIIHPFFSPCTNKSGKNEAPLIICPVAPV